MMKLTVLTNKGHVETDIDCGEVYTDKNIALILVDQKELIHALEYLFEGLVKEKYSIPWGELHTSLLSTKQLIVLNLSILAIYAVKYSGTHLTHLVLGTKEWLHSGGLDAIEEMNNILSPPIQPDPDLGVIDMPVCGGCPLIDCTNCPIFI